jgi:hypothetical protein
MCGGCTHCLSDQGFGPEDFDEEIFYEDNKGDEGYDDDDYDLPVKGE